MLFEVIQSDNDQSMMSTEYVSCIPFEYLDAMSKGGYYFKLDGKRISLKDAKNMNSDISSSISNSLDATTNVKPRGIRCIDTGEIFKTQSEAARHYNIDPAQVSDSIKTGRPRSGHTFEKVTS